MAFLDWMLAVVDRAAAPERLMPLYTVTGHEVGAEAEITELAGYAGSRPVRVGNAPVGRSNWMFLVQLLNLSGNFF